MEKQQIDRFISKVLDKFNFPEVDAPITDIHVRVNPDTGDLMAFDDEDREITRCVVEAWIDDQSETFYEKVTIKLRQTLEEKSKLVDKMSIIKPFSFVLEDEDGEHRAELYVSDDELAILGGDLMTDLDKDLHDFFSNLMKE